jgi:pimeloyl-ACP methyl ester carboxylesterase
VLRLTTACGYVQYAVEWKGIGRSDRPKWHPKTDEEMDDFFVESIEDWRRELNLDRFILCGHSMGVRWSTKPAWCAMLMRLLVFCQAMYCSYFADKYPQRIEHLILISPAGVNSSGLKDSELPSFLKLTALFYITPMVRCVSRVIVQWTSTSLTIGVCVLAIRAQSDLLAHLARVLCAGRGRNASSGRQ